MAAKHEFRVVDVRLNLGHDLGGLGAEPWHSPGPLRVRLGAAEDLRTLRPLAARSHRSTRFYFDGRFPRDRCDALYERWIERALAGRDRELLVADLEGAPIGYQAITLPEGGTGRVDLIAVSPEHRARGLGRALLLSALRRLRALGAHRVVTAMQARNALAVRRHEDVGFVIELTQVWHHKWYRGPDGG